MTKASPHDVVKVLPPLLIKRYCPDPEAGLDLSLALALSRVPANESVVLYYLYPDKEPLVYKSLNQRLAKLCGSSPHTSGLACLSAHNLAFSASQIEEYSCSPHLRGFVLDCRRVGEGSRDYTQVYTLLRRCAQLNKPVLLTVEDGENSFQNAAIISQAVCRIILDGVLDSCPALQLIVETDVVVPYIVKELRKVDEDRPSSSKEGASSSKEGASSSKEGASSSKDGEGCRASSSSSYREEGASSNKGSQHTTQHSSQHYLNHNFYWLSTCSDELYVQYLVTLLGDNQILLGGGDSGDENPNIASIGQLAHQKIMGVNARCVFGLDGK